MSGEATSGCLVVSGRPRFEVEGEEKTRLAADLVRLSVAHDDEGAVRFEAVFLNWGLRTNQSAPEFLYFDREILDVGRRLVVRAGGAATEAAIFDGAITRIAAVFGDLRPPEIRVQAEIALPKPTGRPRPGPATPEKAAAVVSRVARELGLSMGARGGARASEERWQVCPSSRGFLRDFGRDTDMDVALDIACSDLTFVPRRSAAKGQPGRPTKDSALLHLSNAAAAAHGGAPVLVQRWSVVAREPVEDAPSEGAAGLAAAKEVAVQRAGRLLVGNGTTAGTPALAVGVEVDLLDLGGWFSGRWSISSVRHTWSQIDGMRTHFQAQRREPEVLS